MRLLNALLPKYGVGEEAEKNGLERFTFDPNLKVHYGESSDRYVCSCVSRALISKLASSGPGFAGACEL